MVAVKKHFGGSALWAAKFTSVRLAIHRLRRPRTVVTGGHPASS